LSGQGKVREKYFFGKVRENEMLQLVKDLLSRFVKRDVIDSLVISNDVTSFDANDEPNTTLLFIWLLSRQNYSK